MIEKSQLTFKKLALIWWAMAWRGVLAGVVGGAVAGALAGLTAALVGHPELSGPAGQWAGLAATGPIGIWALREALTKPYPGFELMLRQPTEVFSDV